MQRKPPTATILAWTVKHGWNKPATNVYFTTETWTLAQTHDLSEAMVHELARGAGGERFTDMRSLPALVRRGIYRALPTDEPRHHRYKLTSKGKALMKRMFSTQPGEVPRRPD